MKFATKEPSAVSHTPRWSALSRPAILLLSVLSSCGYALQGGGTVLPPDVRSVYIPIVQNDSTESGLGPLLTESLQDRFGRFGVLTIVEDPDTADAVLRVKIRSVRRATNTVTANTETALQRDTSMKVTGELRRTSGPLLWRNDGLEVAKPFGTSSESVVTTSADFAAGGLSSGDLGNLNSREVARGQEEEALNDLVDLVASRIYDQAVAPSF